MAITTRNYIRGVPQTVVLAQMEQSDGSNQHVRRDGILVNGFSDLVLYADSGGASPLPLTSYNSTTVDADWTADESGFTGKTVYSQYQITDATYQGVDIWANFSDFGTYTDNDAPYLRVGVQTLITASGTLSPSIGATCEMVTVDTSLGNIALTIEAPVFVGQCMDIICDGTGYVDVTFPGQESTAPVRVTNGKKLSLKGKSGGDWIADSGVTAEWLSGDFVIEQSSIGEQIEKISIAGTASASISNAYGSSSGTTFQYAVSSISFPVPFLDVPKVTSSPTGGSTRITRCSNPLSTETGSLALYVGSISSDASGDYTFEGDY